MQALVVLAAARADPSLAGRVHPAGPDIWAQVRYARDHEWAATAQDVIRGRTTLALRGLDGPEVRAGVGRVLAGGDP